MKDKRSLTGTVFVACMFVGMGVGYFVGHMTAGMFIGMGTGFAAMAILRISASEREEE